MLIYFLGFQDGCLFEVGANLKVVPCSNKHGIQITQFIIQLNWSTMKMNILIRSLLLLCRLIFFWDLSSVLRYLSYYQIFSDLFRCYSFRFQVARGPYWGNMG